MQRVLSSDLWEKVRAAARRAPSRKAAIAYVTRDLVGFRKDDLLIVDASTRAIAAGETDAPLLRALHRKGVSLFHCPNLHAKVLWLGELAVIGSGNMSAASARDLVEAAVLTDNSATVSNVESLIEQLVQQSDALTPRDIDRLCRIKVVRRGGGSRAKRPRPRARITPLGNRTWLVGVGELTREPSDAEQKKIAQAERTLRRKLRIRNWSWIGFDGAEKAASSGNAAKATP